MPYAKRHSKRYRQVSGEHFETRLVTPHKRQPNRKLTPILRMAAVFSQIENDCQLCLSVDGDKEYASKRHDQQLSGVHLGNP